MGKVLDVTAEFQRLSLSETPGYCRMFFSNHAIALSCSGGFTQQNTKQLIIANNFTGFGGFDTGTYKSRIVRFLAVGELSVPVSQVNFPFSHVLSVSGRAAQALCCFT